MDWKNLPLSYWREKLTPEQFHVTREHGTERPWSGEYCASHEEGLYVCVCCEQPLFRSARKFESGTGWPSFDAPVKPDAVVEIVDRSYGMERTEIRCSRCDAHLGHVFPDGVTETRLRYCMNSVALRRISD